MLALASFTKLPTAHKKGKGFGILLDSFNRDAKKRPAGEAAIDRLTAAVRSQSKLLLQRVRIFQPIFASVLTQLQSGASTKLANPLFDLLGRAVAREDLDDEDFLMQEGGSDDSAPSDDADSGDEAAEDGPLRGS